jgi:ankyrin repeat protein
MTEDDSADLIAALLADIPNGSSDDSPPEYQRLFADGDAQHYPAIDPNWTHPETGLPLLHYALGANRPNVVRLLLGHGARVGPDAHGRWPSILALRCECDDEVCDLIEEAEALVETRPAVSQASTTQAPEPRVTDLDESIEKWQNDLAEEKKRAERKSGGKSSGLNQGPTKTR